MWTRFESLYLLTQIVLFIILNAYAQSRNADAEKMADIIVSALVFFIAFIIVITLDASQMPRAFRLIGLAIGILNSVRLLFRKDITGEDIFGDMQFCPLICLSMRDTAYAALFNVVLFFLKHLIIAAFFPAYWYVASPCHVLYFSSTLALSTMLFLTLVILLSLYPLFHFIESLRFPSSVFLLVLFSLPRFNVIAGSRLVVRLCHFVALCMLKCNRIINTNLKSMLKSTVLNVPTTHLFS